MKCLKSLPSSLKSLDRISNREIVMNTNHDKDLMIEGNFTLLCKRRKRSCNVTLDVPQAHPMDGMAPFFTMYEVNPFHSQQHLQSRKS